MDIVGMALERRMWAQEVKDDCVEAVNVYSDASPVTGAEIQGMIVDVVHRAGTVRRVTLPGATLQYGRTDAINKAMAFVWAVFLCFGPFHYTMQFFFDHVRSFTTDFGNEMKTVELPLVLPAFLAWIAGRPLSECGVLIDHSIRQCRVAIRIAGWNHACGNLMKFSVRLWPTWPKILEQLRALCRFFRVETWRQSLTRRLRDRIPGLQKTLKSFTANIAKWRFETMVTVCAALKKLRRLCQEFLREELFSNFQDRQLLQDVVNSCRDARLWQWISLVNDYIMEPLEHIRRWGMCCPCCKDLRDAGKFVSCVNVSRRIHQAWEFVQEEIEKFRQKAKDLTPAMCEDSNYMCTMLKSILRQVADALHKRWKYFGVVPWLFSLADTIAGAKECMIQVRARPLPDHDPATRDIVARLEHDLDVRASGGPCSAALAAEASAIKRTPLDESCGEGFHRTTNHEKVRAPSAATAHLKRQNRVKGVCKMVRAWVLTHGKRGKAVLDFEWHNYTRILQVLSKNRWRPRRGKPRDLAKQIYREDDRAEEDWTTIMSRVPLDRPVETATHSSRENLENEYLAATFKAHEYYSVEHEHPEPVPAAEGGADPPASNVTHFQLLSVMQAKKREQLMHTVQSADDVTRVEGLVMHVVFLDQWVPPDGPADATLRVFPEADDEWVVPSRIADVERLLHNMTHYRRVEQDREHPGCVQLFEPEVAKPRLALTDMPTLALVWHLRANGWDPVAEHHVHQALPAPGSHPTFDSRESTRMKFYYMALTQLDKVLPLAGEGMPSQEPVGYYRCLLSGKAVEPGNSAKSYALVWNRSRKKDDKQELLPLEDGPKPDDPEDFFRSARRASTEKDARVGARSPTA